MYTIVCSIKKKKAKKAHLTHDLFRSTSPTPRDDHAYRTYNYFPTLDKGNNSTDHESDSSLELQELSANYYRCQTFQKYKIVYVHRRGPI